MGAYNETWEFTPASFFTINKWVAKANYPGPVLGYATGFAINSKGYLANGFGHTTNPTYQNSLYEYSPSTNTWSSKANFPGAGREMSRSFVSSGYGYVGGGKNAEVRFIDFYRYSPWENKWIRIADYNPLGVLLNCFVINSQGYAVWSTNYFQPYKMRKYIPKTCVPLSP
jgi:N-acetylneuraminic acid mutarotase